MSVSMQVLVFDLDQTIVHTPKPAEQHRLEAHQQSGRVIDIATQDENLKKQLCAPRSHILDFFCGIKDTHHVLYCTAGEHSYGVAVVQCLRDFMLRNDHLDDGTQNWIRDSTDARYAFVDPCINASVEHAMLQPGLAFKTQHDMVARQNHESQCSVLHDSYSQ